MTITLQQLNKSGNTGKGEQSHANTVNASSVRRITRVGAARVATSRLATVITLVGLLVVAGAGHATLDSVALLEFVEEVAEVGDIGGGGDGDRTLDVVKAGELDPKKTVRVVTIFKWLIDSLLEVTAENNGTRNALQQGEPVNGRHSSVVLDGEATLNLGKERHRNVGELLVVDEGDIVSDLGNVRRVEGLELGVLIELDRRSDLGEGWDRERLDVGNLNLSSELELVHSDIHVVSVVVDDKLTGDVDEIGVEGGHALVVVNLEVLDSSDAKTAQIADESIGNPNAGHLSNTLGTEVQAAELRQLDHADLADALQGSHLEGAKELEVLELEFTRNGVDGGGSERDQARGIVDNEVTLNLLGAINHDVTGKIGVNGDIGIDNVARDNRGSLGDGDILGACGSCFVWLVGNVNWQLGDGENIPETVAAPNAKMAAERSWTECIVAWKSAYC